ncbi:DUF1010 domain-containing protein [Comamonas sp.]
MSSFSSLTPTGSNQALKPTRLRRAAYLGRECLLLDTASGGSWPVV